MVRKDKSFKTNTLYYYADQYLNKPVDESEIAKIDMTDILYKELEYMIVNGELVIININAKVRLGKTTVAMALGKDIFEMLKKNKQRSKDEEFGMKNIARDQQEYSKMMRNVNTKNTVIVTDESNELEKTGENITVEAALNRVFSDVQAARYVHRICCSPKENIDANADVQLEVIAQDQKNMITHCRLYFNLFKGGQTYTILLGHVNIDVKPIISNWVKNVRDIYYKTNRTEEDNQRIKEEQKKDWYVDYIIKKHEKMDLITKEGIFKPRSLDYAETNLEIVNSLKKLTKMSNIIDANIVRNYIKMVMRKRKIPMSIVGEKLATDEVMGILNLYKQYHKVNKQQEVFRKKMERKEIDPEVYIHMRDEANEVKEVIMEAIKAQIEELEKHKEINDRYRISDENEMDK